VEHYVYSVLITAIQEFCAPIPGCMIGILCAHARIYLRERKALHAIAPHRMPIDTCGWHTRHHCHLVCQLPNRFKICLSSVGKKWYLVRQLLFIDHTYSSAHSSIIAKMRWHTGFQSAPLRIPMWNPMRSTGSPNDNQF
jgi:hypothetical protein